MTETDLKIQRCTANDDNSGQKLNYNKIYIKVND